MGKIKEKKSILVSLSLYYVQVHNFRISTTVFVTTVCKTEKNYQSQSIANAFENASLSNNSSPDVQNLHFLCKSKACRSETSALSVMIMLNKVIFLKRDLQLIVTLLIKTKCTIRKYYLPVLDWTLPSLGRSCHSPLHVQILSVVSGSKFGIFYLLKAVICDTNITVQRIE